MLIFGHHAKIFLYRTHVDMRFGYDRLAGICREQIGKDPFSGQMFVFMSKDRTRAKVFFYDGTGCCLFSKRLEIGRFQIDFDHSDQPIVLIPPSVMMLILSGQRILTQSPKKKWDPVDFSFDKK
jgi:transposase